MQSTIMVQYTRVETTLNGQPIVEFCAMVWEQKYVGYGLLFRVKRNTRIALMIAVACKLEVLLAEKGFLEATEKTVADTPWGKAQSRDVAEREEIGD